MGGNVWRGNVEEKVRKLKKIGREIEKDSNLRSQTADGTMRFAPPVGNMEHTYHLQPKDVYRKKQPANLVT